MIATGALVWLVLAAGDGDAAARLEAANAAYLAGDFEEAARGYEALLAGGWETPALHLDLGNARFRLGRRGLAIASYQRALRLDPGDADARANLALARSGNVDRVVGAADPPLLARAVTRTPGEAAAAALAACWTLLWVALAWRRRSTRRARSGLAALAALALAGTAGAAAVLALKASELRTSVGIVTAAATPVREGPEEALRPVFELHEGTQVRLLEARGGSARVRLENGLEGWIAAADVEPL